MLDSDESLEKSRANDISPGIKPQYKTPDEIISALKTSELYSNFRIILNKKIQNEERSKEILIKNKAV